MPPSPIAATEITYLPAAGLLARKDPDPLLAGAATTIIAGEGAVSAAAASMRERSHSGAARGRLRTSRWSRRSASLAGAPGRRRAWARRLVPGPQPKARKAERSAP